MILGLGVNLILPRAKHVVLKTEGSALERHSDNFYTTSLQFYGRGMIPKDSMRDSFIFIFAWAFVTRLRNRLMISKLGRVWS
jgi:hypothetical protein